MFQTPTDNIRDMIDPNEGAYCRICGSSKLNDFYLSTDLFHKVDLNHALQPDTYLNQLIRPCECRGEFAFAHRVCLADWIETTRHEFCDICRFKYNIKIFDKSFFDWMSESDQVERLLKSASCAILVVYLSCLGLLFEARVCIPTMLDRFIYISASCWLIASFLATTLFCAKLVREFREWRHMNKRVLVDANENPQLDVTTRPRDVLKSSGFRT